MPERIDSAIRFFLYVLIFWLPYSPAVVETCVIISFLLWLLKRAIFQRVFRREQRLSFWQKIFAGLKRFQPLSSDLNKPIALFIAICILSVASSSFFEISAHNFLTKTLEWFIVYFLIIEVFQEKKHIHTALSIWVFTAFSTIIDSLVQYYLTHRDLFLGHVIDSSGRATAGFKAPNGLGAYLSLFIPFVLSLAFLDTKAKRYRFAGILALGFGLWSLMLTSSRGAILGTAIGILCFLCIFFAGQAKPARFFTWLIAIVAVLLGAYAFLVLSGHIEIGSLIRKQTVQWRLNVWQDTLKMIKDRPVFGHGINTYMMVFEAYRRDFGSNPTYAHNCYLQLAAEVGIAGLLGFLWILGALFHRFFGVWFSPQGHNKNDLILSAGLLSGIISFLVHSFFDTNFYSLQLSVYFWVIAGMLGSLNGHLVGTQPQGRASG
ncbi:MAG TPA: O-antigen ligase family protein [Candidatus Omnitrophota bacterium]|nr:O-antigen ligase family protein [Candidatus Omnitrophota bacterium]